MPLSQAVIGQPVMDAVVREVIEEALLHPSTSRVGVDVPQGLMPVGNQSSQIRCCGSVSPRNVLFY